MDEAAEEFIHVDYDVEPEGVDLCPELVSGEVDQRAAVELPREYNQSVAASSGVDLEYQLPT